MSKIDDEVRDAWPHIIAVIVLVLGLVGLMAWGDSQPVELPTIERGVK